jgi:hypothetical protein
VTGYLLGGLVAGEGSFHLKHRARGFAIDGSERLRFIFSIKVASRDRPLLELLRLFIGVGRMRDMAPRRANWQPLTELAVSSCAEHHAATIPFADTYLLPSAKRDQFEAWRRTMNDYETARLTKTRWGQGRSPCSAEGCDRPVRGRGLCRAHYYRATGW